VTLTIRIDLGHLFPGLLVFLIGVGFFLIWVVIAFFSFFLFFIPGLHGIFYFGLDLLAASLVLMAGGILMIIASTSGWTRGGDRYWWEGRSLGLAARDRLTGGQRAGELFALLVSFLILLFFIENQVGNTGFFTSRFGPIEELAFYGSWLVGALVNVAKAAVGRKNAVRPIVAFQSAVQALAAFWLLLVFPFSFAHLTALLPQVVRPAFFWVSDPIGWLAILLVGLASVGTFFYNSVVYFTIRAGLENRETAFETQAGLGRL